MILLLSPPSLLARLRRTLGLACGLVACAAVHAAPAEPLGCLITPSVLSEIGTPAVGVIQQLLVERGDMVKAGQLLATLRGDVERAGVSVAHTRANAEAELRAALLAHDFAQRKLERTRNLYQQEFVSAQAVDQAQAEAQQAEARKKQAVEQSELARKELAVANAQLDNRSIRSPINGVVLDVYRRNGERVEDRPILKLATLDPLHVEVVLPSTLYGRPRSGSVLRIQPALAGMAGLTATVSIVDRVIDPASNTFRVRAVLPNPDLRIPAGLRCQAELLDGAAASASAETVPRPVR